MATIYLEIDDEITSAIGRIRAVRDGEVVIVVPPGSRIATSRINFKLLAREATGRRLNMVAVSDEPQVRALAISAGLPAYDSIPAAEQALAGFREQDRRLAERLGRQTEPEVAPGPVGGVRSAGNVRSASGVGRVPSASEATQILDSGDLRAAAVGRAVDQAVAPAAAPATATVAERFGRRSRVGVTPVVFAVALLVLLALVGYGAYAFLPTATIRLVPRATVLRPAPVAVTADPSVAVSDVATGVVPAEVIEIPLSVQGEFTATGLQVREVRAQGSVRFRSENTLNDVPLPQGTIISTPDGVDFETTAPATVPRADFATSTPGTVDVPVRASRPGTRGNVAAGAISGVPPSLAGQLVSVRNPDPTDGGRSIQESVVTQADFDAALITLDGQLEAALASALSQPSTTPRGLTLFFSSAQTGDAQPVPSGPEVVGVVQPTFSVTLASMGTVSAVNEELVDQLAAERLRQVLPFGQQIVGDQVETTHTPGEVQATRIIYSVQASASIYSQPDSGAIVAAVLGKPVPQAKQILAPYGMVEIAVWPDFIDRLPDQAARISLTIVSPVASPGSSPSPGPSRNPSPPAGPSG